MINISVFLFVAFEIFCFENFVNYLFVVVFCRARVALTGLAIAEYFRDQEGQGRAGRL